MQAIINKLLNCGKSANDALVSRVFGRFPSLLLLVFQSTAVKKIKVTAAVLKLWFINKL